jgi:hypothetical protein
MNNRLPLSALTAGAAAGWTSIGGRAAPRTKTVSHASDDPSSPEAPDQSARISGIDQPEFSESIVSIRN